MDMVDLAKSFMAGANASKKVASQTVSGLAVSDSADGRVEVQIAGTTVDCSCWPSVKEGETVTVTVVNRRPVVTGVAGWGDAVDLRVTSLAADIAYIRQAYIDQLVAGSVTAEQIAAATAYIGTLETNKVSVTDIVAATGYVGELEAGSVTVSDLAAATAMVGDLEAGNVTAGQLVAAAAYVGGLVADEVTVDKLTAAIAQLANLSATYAQIDWANIDVADIGALLAKSGIIQDLVTASGTVTGELVGVTISGDLVKAGTLVADKLVLLGDDGLYYALNTDGETVEARQTQYNALDGSHIIAQSITANKVSVTDLVAFGATIGGLVIENGSVHSYAKSGMDSTVSGVYIGADGSLNLGGASTYLKYDAAEGALDIRAKSLSIGATDMATAVVSTVQQWYVSTSPDAPSGGSWSGEQPTWQEGAYLWCRDVTTKADGTVVYGTPYCATGNTGEPATYICIDPSAGTTFRRDDTETVLQVTVLHGSETATTFAALQAMLPGSSLEWTRVEQNGSSSIVPSTDSRLSDSGMALTVLPSDVSSKAVFNVTLTVPD